VLPAACAALSAACEAVRIAAPAFMKSRRVIMRFSLPFFLPDEVAPPRVPVGRLERSKVSCRTPPGTANQRLCPKMFCIRILSQRAGAGDRGAGKSRWQQAPASEAGLHMKHKMLWSRTLPAAASLCGILLAGSLCAFGASSEVKSDLDQARACEKANDYAGAERAYQQALNVDPRNPEVLKRYGILLQTELQFPQSIELFERALAVDAQYPQVNFFMGVSYLGENHFQKACDSFKLELATPRPHPRCHYYYAIALESLGKPDEAIAQFRQSLAQNPKDLDALYELASLHMNAALADIQTLTDLAPDSFQLHKLMGEVYANSGRNELSLKEYKAALAKRPDAPGLHYALGTAYRNLRMIDQAQKEFLEARKEDPNDPRVNLYLGEFAVGRHDYAGAIPYLLIVVAAQPAMARPHFLLGECYRALKQPDKAKSEFLDAIQDDPKNPQPHFELAQVYRELGNSEGTARELEAFQKLSLAEKSQALERAQTTPQ
jgi:tetratricopeptide (TPR) repeat protein